MPAINNAVYILKLIYALVIAIHYITMIIRRVVLSTLYLHFSFSVNEQKYYVYKYVSSTNFLL